MKKAASSARKMVTATVAITRVRISTSDA